MVTSRDGELVVGQVVDGALRLLVLGVGPDGPVRWAARQVGQAGLQNVLGRRTAQSRRSLAVREFHYPVNVAEPAWKCPISARDRYSRNSPRLMIVFWISQVPSPMSRNGASRMRRSISYSFE